MANIPTIEEMLKAGMHFGHRTSRWHPKMAPFIFTSRNGVHVFDLVKTRQMLAEALDFITKSISENKTILFVGTKMQVKSQLAKMAAEASVPYVSEKWLGGLFTNFAVVKKLIKKYKDLLEKKEAGKLDKYTKKERLEFDREINKLSLKVGGLTNLIKIPDAIFIWDIKNEKTALREAKMKNVPVVAVCDTNANPDGVTNIIPANDDATKSAKMILKAVKEAILEGRKILEEKKNNN
jgi:small subunit ribosomal protein S2